MTSKKAKEKDFLEKLIGEIRFFPVKKEIEEEYSDHINDKVQELIIEEQLPREEALSLTIEEIGDPHEIGKALNEVHNPFLGWALLLTKGLLITFGAFAIHLLILFTTDFFLYGTGDAGIEEHLVIAEVPIDQEIQMDAVTYYFDRAIIQDNGNALILIEAVSYRRPPRIRGFLFNSVHDDLGNNYSDFTIPYRSRIFRQDLFLRLRDIDDEAEFLILQYKRYNREFEITVPFPERSETP